MAATSETVDEIKPGEHILRSLFLEFCLISERKIEQVLAEPLERPLAKSLQRGEDPQFDQLLLSLSTVAEQCLPSLLRALFRWYERQYMLEEGSHGECRYRHKSKGGKDFLCERRDLAIEFIYCLVLIEVLSKLSFHPGHDDLVGSIITQAFKHFKYKDGFSDWCWILQSNPNAANINIIADLYAEVIGVVAQSRFPPVRKTFLSELKELKLRDQTPYTAQSIISLLMGLKVFRVKMHPIEDFEACVQFLHELGHYFLEVKDRDIKHALAGLFVEILLPVAATAKNEVNVPVLKTFVDMMYAPCVDLTTKKRNILHMFPLVTCLLCVSQKTFFLNNWPYFLTTCLSSLKHKDTKTSRVALESLYRLLWVYMVRIKCESNTATNSRLQSIVNSLFPKGSKLVMPRDTPLNIFVKIIQFIAKERLDFAMKEIIFDLLSVGKQAKVLNPERMSIGLRAFLVIADSLQQKDGDPPMPQSTATLPSGSTVRVKRTFLNKMLTDSMAKNIGLSQYYSYILKTFTSILRALDLQVGRPLLLTKAENVNKEPEEVLIGDRKPKIDLYRTCIAAIPRLLPEGMKPQELVEILTILTVHFDEELRGLAFQALQNLMHESDKWKEHVVRGYVQFVQKDISDTNTQQLDGSLRMLMQLLSKFNSPPQKSSAVIPGPLGSLAALHEVEGLALVMLCSHRTVTRKLAAHLLKEVRLIVSQTPVTDNTPDHGFGHLLIDVMDESCPVLVERLLPSLPPSEKTLILNSSHIDLHWVIERSTSSWSSHDKSHDEPHSESTFIKVDPWMQFIAKCMSKDFVMSRCVYAVAHAWPIVMSRLTALYTLLDPNTMTNEYRASSLLRSGSKKVTTERDLHMQLWQNYVILACCIAQKKNILTSRSSTPDSGAPSEGEKGDTQKNGEKVSDLFHLLVPIMKCESADIRNTVVNGLGYTNPPVFTVLKEELVPFLKEAIDRKQESKRRRKRDVLRVQLARIFEIMTENRTFADSDTGVIDKNEGCLSKTFVEYIDGARLYLESESDRDLPILQDIRIHFSRFIRNLIYYTPVEYKKTLLSRELRYSLFDLFASWSGKFSHTSSALDKRLTKDDNCTELELSAVRAMSAVVTCGPVFDSNGLNDDGYIYNWLDRLLSSHDDRIYQLAKETVVLLLDFNSETAGLLDWAIDKCYTGSTEVADGCFSALAAVFQAREYPCDHVAMLNLAMLNVGSPQIVTHEAALQLLHLLDTRFFQEEPVLVDSVDEPRHHHLPINDVLLSVSYSQSQMYLSEQLAQLHPDLTMPIFSEITHRFQTAKPAVCHSLLKYLLPWLHNMELVDPSLPQSNPFSSFLTRLQDVSTETFKPPLKGEGWGSPEATKMVLNNLFYITVKFGDDHTQELEALWAALVVCWPNNLKIVLHYLVIITNIAATELLPYAQRVVSYLGRARPERLADELMNELQTVETLNVNIERTQTPPFFRLSNVKKPNVAPNTTDDEKLENQVTDCTLEKGTLHTKRHSANNDDLVLDSLSCFSFLADDEMSIPSPVRIPESRINEYPDPYPLPMPAYGGYFAPLSEYLPESLQPSSGFHRSNIAVMFLSNLVLDGLEIDWSAHLPLMLHIVFLGLDHNRELVYEHCKKLIQNLMLLASAQEHPQVSRILLAYRSDMGDTLKLISGSKETAVALTEETQSEETSTLRPVMRVDSTKTLTPGTPVTPTTPDQPRSSYTETETRETILDVVKKILDVLTNRRGRPLWSYEDITPKTLVTQSAVQLEYFLKLIVNFFSQLSPLALVEQRWSQVALQLSLSCSSRHYAGRSFQVLRALHIRPTSQMLADILSRLVETVAEQGEDMQGYVTEIILTLEELVDNLDLEVRPVDYMREIYMSTPNLAKDLSQGDGRFGMEGRRGAMMAPKQSSHGYHQHARSTSYCVNSAPTRATPFELRFRGGADIESRLRTNVPRSRSEKSLKNLEHGTEDKLTIVSQMFWIAVSLLESDYEYEFLLACRLLEKILQHMQPERHECRERLEKIQQQIKWTNFPGVQTLLLKGCTSQATYESTWHLLSRLTVCIDSPLIDPTGNLGFPVNVIVLFPHLVQMYENPTQACRDAADHISQICSQKSERLSNLGTVMSLYSRGTFGKDSFQWTKCVVKYLHDVYAPASLSMISFLVEVLEKGPLSYQPAILQILHCMVHYIDLSSSHHGVLNAELFSTVAKHVEGAHWKEALKIMKLTVTRSSTLAAVPPSSNVTSDFGVYTSHMSFAESEIIHKKELPGRILDFSVDLTETAIIGRKYLNTEVHGATDQSVPSNESSLSRKSGSDTDSVWKRPQASQARTRERLTELLSCYGQKRLPKSPSMMELMLTLMKRVLMLFFQVIFSQSSDTLDHQQSVVSSGDDSLPDNAQSSDALYSDSNGTDLINMTIKGFDFLDNELGESEENDYFSQLGDRRHSLSLDSPEPEMTRPRCQYGSVPDLKLLDTLNMSEFPSNAQSTESISLKEETFSDHESFASLAHETDACVQSTPAGISSIIVIQNPGLGERRKSSPLTASTHSLNSVSDLDTVELGSSAASSNFPQLYSAYLCTIQSDEIEDAWKQHVMDVMSESSAATAVRISYIFPRLYRELRRRLATITKEAGYYIAKSDSLRSIATQLYILLQTLQVLDLMFTHLECPYFFTEADILIGSGVVDRHKRCLLEMQECFETYCMRKDQTEQCLESIKSSIKQQSLGDGGTSPPLYSLVFQLVLLFENYLKLLDVFCSVRSSPQVADMSLQVSVVKRDIFGAQSELENGQVSPLNEYSPKTFSKQEAISSMLEYLRSQQYQKAIQLLRSFRSIWPDDLFGQSSDDDTVTLLNIYCGGLAEKSTGIFVLTELDFDVGQLYSLLMDINFQLRNWSPGTPSPSSADNTDHPDSSTL
ncbi:hypothetical protein ACJMK2_032086 [Sinanodonta woodiana]|uniref:Uncharacterized protein n=1 Tax=Sinanodonta woodiana TaxID=1069815 RepID=A0ABD3X0N9_SINWO